MASPPGAASQRRKRNSPGNPSPVAEVIELSPKSLMATNRFMCEVCNKGFQREQNLQIHRRVHNLPWKLKQKTNHEVMRRKVYICPELDCVRHDPARALGDLTGIKKHFSRKHREKKFNCDKCNKKYAVHSDLKAHNKICGPKEYKCDRGNTFTRRHSFMCHRSFCDALAQEVTRHTTNRSPYSSTAGSILANASNPCSMSMGPAAGLLIPGNHQQFSSPLYGLRATTPNSFTNLLSEQLTESAFQRIQPPSMPLHPGAEPKQCFPRASDFSGIHGFPSYTTTSSMFNFGVNGSADLKNPHNDLDLNTKKIFSGLMMNVEASRYNILNSNSASPQLTDTALLQKAVTGANSNNASLMKSTGSSLSDEMKFNSYTRALGDGMSSGGGRGGGSTFEGMYNNLNVGGARYGSARGYSGRDQLSAGKCRGMMYNVNNDVEMLLGEVKVNAGVEPHMNVQSEYCCEKLTRDFLGLGIGMHSLSGDGTVDHNGNGTGSNFGDSEPTTSADARPFLPRRCPGF